MADLKLNSQYVRPRLNLVNCHSRRLRARQVRKEQDHRLAREIAEPFDDRSGYLLYVRLDRIGQSQHRRAKRVDRRAVVTSDETPAVQCCKQSVHRGPVHVERAPEVGRGLIGGLSQLYKNSQSLVNRRRDIHDGPTTPSADRVKQFDIVNAPLPCYRGDGFCSVTLERSCHIRSLLTSIEY